MLEPVWEKARAAITKAHQVLVLGYSLPEYDDQVIELLRSSPTTCRYHIFDPAPALTDKYERLLGRRAVQHSGLPGESGSLAFS